MKVLLLGGGTGGHLYPLLNVTKKFKELKGNRVEFLYIGPKNRFSKQILEDNGIKVKGIFTAKWRRYFSLRNFLDIFLFPLGFFQSLVHVLFFMPDVVFSKGGYGSVAPTIAARLYWIPILIHESDTVPGMANRFMASLADKVAIYFEGTKEYFRAKKVFLVGNPVREDINQGNVQRAVEIFKLHGNKPVVFVIGGSQGSQFINEQIIKILPGLLQKYQIIHQIGENNFKHLKEFADKRKVDLNQSDYHPFEYLGQEIIHAYKICNLIVSRAGATTIAEIAAVGRPSILVPLAGGANNHQLENAYYVGKSGGAFVMEERNFQGDLLLHKIDQILSSDYLCQKLSASIRNLYYPNASDKIVEALLYLSKEVK
ncbi:MAG: undecaprenyldiphospho-muramoylpentapeptide beta-N-acetylglucosaminyltransferase [Candidatus Moranbacteria bacterium]|nr:undecaprenyldiphospho-muramoylpentapeptide beta-N-acetylglucosaminyltransferase [Candidatus Moranbacteria bacterium]